MAVTKGFIYFIGVFVFCSLWPFNSVITKISGASVVQNHPSVLAESAQEDNSEDPISFDEWLTNIQNEIQTVTHKEDLRQDESLYIEIPKIGLKKKVAINTDPADSKVYLDVIEKMVAHGYGTALPDEENGNTYLFAHSRKAQRRDITPDGGWFTRIDELKKGDTIILVLNSTKYKYIVVDSFIVSPKETSVYTRHSPFEDHNSVTLQTCYPRGDTDNRLIVRAIEN